MQISISARHGHLSPATQEKISEKVSKLPRYFDRTTAIEVTVDLKDREKPIVEVQVSADSSKEFVASDSAQDVLAALDAVLHKIERQLHKEKEKRRNHHVPGGKHVEPASADESSDEGDE